MPAVLTKLPETLPELKSLISEQVAEAMRDFGQPYTLDDSDRLEKVDSQISSLLQDKSGSRMLTGALWLSGASVLNSTITAEKLIVNSLEAITANMGSLNVTGTINAAASYPAGTGARIAINSSELAGYNSSNNKTFSLNVDGSGFVGIGGSKLSWTTAGVVTVPAAAITSLTIADVGSGTFNSNFDAGTGRVRAGTALQRVEITSSGLLAYDTGGTNTFTLSSSDGSLSHTGVHTIRNAASGARVELSNVGLRGFNSGGSQTFGISTTDGSGFFGLTTPVTWNSSGTVVINGSLLVNSTVTAGKMNVSTLSAITANMGTITAGTISAGTVSASTLTTGTITFGSGGTINTTGAIAGTLGGINLASLTVTGNITLGAGGAIVDADGSTWTQSGLVLVSSGSFGDSIKWQVSGTDRASIYADASSGKFQFYNSGAKGYVQVADDGAIISNSGGTTFARADGSGVYLRSALGVGVQLGDAGGTYAFQVFDSGGSQVQFAVASNGAFASPDADGTALGTYAGRIPWYIAGNLRYVPYYNA